MLIILLRLVTWLMRLPKHPKVLNYPCQVDDLPVNTKYSLSYQNNSPKGEIKVKLRNKELLESVALIDLPSRTFCCKLAMFLISNQSAYNI